METNTQIVEQQTQQIVESTPRNKYKMINTFPKDDRALKVKLFNITQSSDDDVIQLSTYEGRQFDLLYYAAMPYISSTEMDDNGQPREGVVSYIYDGSDFYVTSSRSVYNTITRAMEIFGDDGEILTFEVGKIKQQKGNQIVVRLV